MSSHPARSLEGGGLAVRFTLTQDRYEHGVWIFEDPHWRQVLASVEGTPLDDWPPSPPLQSLHLEERDDGRQLALLVGMAGKSHWSLSVQLDSAARSVTFDAACRTRGPGPLGSRYRTLGRAHITLASCDPPGTSRLQSDAQSTTILAAQTSGDQPQTIRWAYTIFGHSEGC